jgi:hypothetical protein
MLQGTSFMVSTNVRELIWSHRYKEAIAVLLQEKAAGDNDIYVSLGEAYLGDRQYENAAAAFIEANRVYDERDRIRTERALDPTRWRTSSHFIWAGTSYWLAGDRDLATINWRSCVDGILAGEITYGDAAGAVTEGLLLWYAGALTRDEGTCKDALKYLTNRAKRSAIKSWPGPLALMVLAKKTAEEVLVEHFGTSDIETAIGTAKTDLLKRRELSQYLLYLGALALREGKEEQYWQRMKQCAALENPIIENEWYIARGAVEQRQDL